MESKLKECKDEVDKSLATLHGRLDALTITAESIKQIHDDVQKMREIIEAWNSAKGFVTTIKFLSAFIRWFAIVGGAVGVGWYLIKFGHMPPTDIK